MTDSGYAPSTAGGSKGGDTYASHDQLKDDYQDFLSGKRLEIDERKESRRYYHTSQYTRRQLQTLKKRGQPPVVYNHEAKKINSVVGLLSRQRGDPKAYPRTMQQEDGAEVATAALRYAFDQQQWEFKNGTCTLFCAVDGLGGVELELEPGDSGKPDDYDVAFYRTDGATYFYDPRSLEPDFSDARYMGVSKFADAEMVIDEFATTDEQAALIRNAAATADTAADLSSNPDSDLKWYMTSGKRKQVRLVDHWYLQRGVWHWCLYTGAVKFSDGVSPFVDEKDNSISKFIMFSANIDQDGDRYGFHRNMKSSQDEINQRRSKALHVSSSRRIIVEDGQGLDVEKIRQEIVKPDGVIVIPPGASAPQFDDVARAQELNAQLGFFQEAKAELESGQFNPEAVGNSEASISGRAIQLRQQAGIAELGPFLLSYRGWKLRLYRAVYSAIRKYWTAERAVRVTDDPNAPRLIPINKMGTHPQTGQPAMINAINALDVDIILDEGPDTITMQQSNADALAALGKSGVPIPPQAALMLSDVDPTVKKQVMDMLNQQSQPGPVQQKSIMLDLETKDAKNQKTRAEAALSMARANSEGQGQGGADPAQLAYDKWKTIFDGFITLKTAEINKGSAMDLAMIDADIDKFLGLSGLANDQMMQLRDHAHDRLMQAMQPPPQPSAQQPTA